MPAGVQLCRLAPLGRRTGANGCFGSPWPTPMAGTPSQNGYNEAGGTDFSRRVEVIAGLRETSNGPKAAWPTSVRQDAASTRNLTAVRSNPESRHHDGTTLLDAVTAAWATPTQRDFHSEKRSPEKRLERIADVRGVTLEFQCLEASGPAPNGESGPTARLGGLNPTFVCWLMGYPIEWAHCAASVTPSSRNLRRSSSKR